MDLTRDRLHGSVTDPTAASMNFLNEIAGQFPNAISLAAGRPHDEFYDVADIDRYLHAYIAHLVANGHSPAAIRTAIMQYGPTNGRIGDLIATMLALDEGIEVEPDAVMVTAGCQEAMIVALRGLCANSRDVLLVAEPCYVGLTGAARVLGIDVIPVPESPLGVAATEVVRIAGEVRAAGRNPVALYAVPNFANPSGLSLSVAARRELLAAAADADLLILEDDPYGLFGLDDEPRPALKSMPGGDRVIYLGSFAKSCFPGARVGFLVADQTVIDASGRRTVLAEELSTVKSMVTVNTSPIAQAVIGGVLVEHGFSLRAANREKSAFYQRNLQALLSALDRHFADASVTWNAPRGGFFAVVDTPVRADVALLEYSAREHGVLWTPMSFFYLAGGGAHAMRLSCSALTPPAIDEGVRRLAALIADAANRQAPLRAGAG